MSTCSRCGYAGTAAGPNCPRCGQPLAQPASARPTLILRLDSPSLPAREWEITDSPMGIGRLDDSDIPVPDKSVSRQHARILPTPTGFDVEDLGSTNGTYVNDKPITDRTRLSNGDRLMIGDVPLRVMLHSVQPAVITPAPPPPPLPFARSAPTPSSGQPSGPSTVFYDIDDALALSPSPTPIPQVEPPRTSQPVEVPTAVDITPTKPAGAPPPPPPPPPIIIDARPAGPVVEQPTLIAGDPVTPTPPPPTTPPPAYEPKPWDPRPTPPPPPPPTYEPRPSPLQPAPIEEARPAPPAYEPKPYDPRPAPPREAQPEPAYEPKSYDPRPAPPREVQPGPDDQPRRAPPPDPRSTPQAPPAPPGDDLSARSMVELADRLATALRVLKGDTRLALWLFEHAGGQAAAQAFVNQSAKADANPDDPIEQARLLSMAPTAARLLEAAVMLANVVSSLQSPDDEAQTDAANLQPIPRP